jgi:hypothetical protein
MAVQMTACHCDQQLLLPWVPVSQLYGFWALLCFTLGFGSGLLTEGPTLCSQHQWPGTPQLHSKPEVAAS